MAEGNVAVAGWLQRLAPDVAATVRRFPLAVILAACATAVFLVGANFERWLDPEGWARLFIGLATGAILAVAGVFFAESRPQAKRAAIALAYVLPIAVAALCQFRDMGWVVPFGLPAVAMLWLSVSGFTRIERGAAREEQQHRFWWINHRAIATAALACLGFLAITLGVIAVERSLSVLFGIESGEVFYRWVLPFTGWFLTPVYWLATLPRLDDFDPGDMDRPDFIASAVGFLGQFVLAPFLAIYAAILLAYAAQIVVTQRLPEGTIGWMVLGFVVAGAATWLVLHPPFMRRRMLVRLFRRSWFWLTVIPLVLFFVAVWVRVDAYGLTAERLILVSGGVWAALLAIVFLVGRGDIRLIPALAGATLLLFSVGQWNYVAWPNNDQGARLSHLLTFKADETATVSSPVWTEEQLEEARGAIYYLDTSDHGRTVLSRVLLDYGFVYDPKTDNPYDFLAEIGYPQTSVPDGQVTVASRDITVPIDVSATPFYVGHQDAWQTGPSGVGFEVTLKDGALEVYRDGVLILSQPLGEWAGRQLKDGLVEPWIDFSVEGVSYRLALTSATWLGDPTSEDGPREVTGLTGVLFADDGTVSIPRP